MNEIENKNEIGDKNIKYIFDLLKSGEEYIKLSHERDVILVLGNTGAGKSTLTEFLTGNNDDLFAIEVSEGSGDFIITDTDNKISAESTIISKTTFPDLYIHEQTGAYYYDCPGFSDTRSAAHDISTTYFIKKVIDSAKAVKFLFVVNYSSVRKGVDRKDFILLLKHLTTLLKNIDKYKNSIALVVTKVDNQYKKMKGQMSLVPDEKVIEAVVDFLRVVKKDIQAPNNIPTINLSDSIQFSSKALVLINALLENVHGSYKKIGIFRRPDELGLLSKSELLQDGKQNLEKMINDNISYMIKNSSDFGYTISAESINYVQDLSDIINESITLELSNIGEHIQKLMVRDENNINDITSLSHTFQMGVEILAAIEGGFLNDLKTFVKSILRDLKFLNKSVPIEDLRSIIQLNDYLIFLEIVSGKQLKKTAEWSIGLIKISKYFNSSKKWYDFLNELEEWLSEYQIQEYKNDIDVVNLIQQCSTSKEKKTFEIDIKQLLDQIKVYKPDLNVDIIYTDIKDLTLSPEKLKFLKRVLDSTLQQETKVLCTEPKRMNVSGKFVRISNVMQNECWENVQFIEILALKKVFFDKDINKIGKKVQISIAAPIWEIIGNRKIILDGEAGRMLGKASIGINKKGNDGMPGDPGGPGGSFLGLTGRVMGSSLLISSVGGSGGKGEDGGDGKKGEKGRDPSRPRSQVTRTIFNTFGPEEDWEDESGISWQFTGHTERLVLAWYDYTATGRPATDGGAGGHGGAGGLGGRGGIIKMVDLSESGKVSVISRDGNLGKDGEGGFGGAGAPNGATINVSCRINRLIIISIVAFTDCEIIKKIPNGSSNQGSNGRKGSITDGRKSPIDSIELRNPQNTINDFKKILREALLDATKASCLIEFLDKLTNNKNIKKLHSTLGLVEELEGLENQFSMLNGNINIMHFYKSLLKSIDEYAMKPRENERSSQHKKVLAYLYTATLSKISALNNKHKDIMIIDIYSYLDLLINEFDHFDVNRKNLAMSDVVSDYKKGIQERMKNARGNINEKILPEINSIFENVEEEIYALVNESINLIQNAEHEREQLRKKQKELERFILLKYLFYPLKMIGEFMNSDIVEGIMVTVAGGIDAVSRHMSIIGGHSIQDESKPVITTLPEIIDNLLLKMFNIFNEKRGLFINQLQDLANLFDESRHYMSSNLSVAHEELLTTLESGRLDSEEPDALWQKKEEVGEVLSRQRDMLEDSMASQEELKAISQGQKLLIFDAMSSKLYRSLTCDEIHIKFIGEIIGGLKKKIKVLHQFEISIYNMIIPKIKHFKKVMTEVINSKETLVGEPEINKWSVKNIINEIKYEVRHSTKGLDLGEELTRCLEKIEETLEVLFDVYDRLEVLENKSELAAYIANIHLADSIIVNDNTLRRALQTLEMSISSNLLLEKYNRALSSFTQSVFPFAPQYLDEYKLPTSLEAGLGNMTSIAKQNLLSLKTKILESKISIGEYDEFIHSDVEFSSRNKNSQPFFKWSHEPNSITIARILNGKEAELNADIRSSFLQDAVKFREIGLSFRLQNESLQMEFEERLRKFEVVMIHHGQSHYKCGNSFYTINSKKQALRYHMESDSQGRSTNRNLVYSKVQKSDAFLSPYTMWTFKLTHPQNNFRSLDKYKNEVIDLELVGVGQYIEHGKLDVEVCNADLQNYYQIDYSMSMIDEEEVIAVDYTNKKQRRKRSYQIGKQGNNSKTDNTSSSSRAEVNNLKSFQSMDTIAQWMYRTKDKMPVPSHLLNRADCTNNRQPEVYSNDMMTSSNLLLWNVVLRKLCYNDKKRTQRVKQAAAMVDNQFLAYRYYAARHLPQPDKQETFKSEISTTSNNIGAQNYYNIPPQPEEVYKDYPSLSEKTNILTFPDTHLLE